MVVGRDGSEPVGDEEVCNSLLLLVALLRNNPDHRRGGHDTFEFHNAATGRSEIIEMVWSLDP